MIKKCKNCNKEFNTRHRNKQHCSTGCFEEYRSRPENIEKTNLRRRDFNLKKYGVDNVAKLECISEKAKKTCLKKYGVISPSQNKVIRDKQINTCLERYGVRNPQQNSELRNRQIESLYKKYKVTIPLKSSEILERVKKTNLDKYGVNNVAMLEENKKKTKATNIKTYGVPYISQNLEIKEKQLQARRINHYNFIVNGSKFTNIIPLFSELEYRGNVSYDTKYWFQCKFCESKFEDTLLNGNIPRCFICNPISKTQTETKILEFIKSILPNETIISNDRKILSGKELDIFISSLNIAIEYDGLFWHSEIGGKKYKNYHLNKTTACKDKQIRLIHIFEDEWIYKQEIVKNKLIHIFNKNLSDKIYARKCDIRLLNADVCNEFLDLNHIQGKDMASLRVGAYYNNELVAVMTFGALRIALGNIAKKNQWEMYRFCTHLNKRVIGIGSKLLSYFIKNYNPEYILSYSDVRWSNTDKNIYKSLGFTSINKNTGPNYWYLGKNYNKRIYRYNFRKHNLKDIFPNFDSNLTEWQNMQLNGYDRIWDCGNLKHEWVPSSKNKHGG